MKKMSIKEVASALQISTATVSYILNGKAKEKRISPELTKKLLYICNNYPVYWNNYYLWNPDKPPKIHIYRHGINFETREDYGQLILDAIYSSIKYTNHFVHNLSL